ncbi:MAG: hypothetical protein M1815_004228 [Lichina confinis]|nr:MAG: hypothetical protein M1815_004228 [Lichina confinis]
MATEVSNTRLYLGNLARNGMTDHHPSRLDFFGRSELGSGSPSSGLTKGDIENHFASHGTGHIVEIKLMNGFGFIEYDDEADAKDVVPAFRGSPASRYGSELMGERLTVQFARGSRPKDPYAGPERTMPRPRRSVYRMQISGLPVETSWQDLKDFARQSGLDVVYSETGRERDGRGFVEYETSADLRSAVEKLDGREFKGARVTCLADTQDERPRERYRSRSPYRRAYMPEEYDHRPPRAYSPPRHGYRDRTPPPRGYYERERYRSPPPRRDPLDDYPPRRPYPADPYEGRDPRRGYEPDPYLNGHARPYGRPPSPRGRPRSPRGYHEYQRRAYW